MVETKFINRGRELKEIDRILSEPRNQPLGLFLIAPSGIGKTRFLTETERRNPDEHFIRIRIRRSRSGRYENGYFLQQMARAIHEKAATNGYPDIGNFNRNFTKYVDLDAMGLEATDELMQEFNIPLVNQIKKLLERQLSIGRFRPKMLLGPNEAAGISYLKLYVRTIAEKSPSIFILENAHLIDEDTLVFLTETIEWPENSGILFEFTQLDARSSANWTLGELAEEFERVGFSIVSMALTPLEYQHYTTVASQKGVQNNDRLRSIYEKEKGNIRSIYDLSAIRVDVLEEEFRHKLTARVAIETMPQDQRLIAIALAIHDDPAPKHRLDAFCDEIDKRTNPITSTREAIKKLVASELAEETQSSVFLAHDTVSRVIDETSDPSLVALARTIWIAVYRKNAIADFEWGRVIRLTAYAGDAAALDNVLDDAVEEARRAHFKDGLISALEKAVETFTERLSQSKSSIMERVLSKIAALYFEIEEFEKTYNLLPSLSVEGMRRDFYLATLLNRLDKDAEAVALAAPYIESTSLVIAEKLPFILPTIASYASLDKRADATPLYRMAIADPLAPRSTLFPFLLRIADIYLPLEESLAPIKQSIEWFKRAGNSVEEAHARNTLCMQLARLGNLNEAMQEVGTADELLAHSAVDQAQVLNNKAAISLMRNDTGDTTELYLTIARDLVRRPFDKTTVALNRAVLLSLRGSQTASAAHEAAIEIAESANHTDKSLLRRAHWNAAQWHYTIGDKKLAKSYLKLAKKASLRPHPLWTARFEKCPPVDPDYNFQSTLPYHISFLVKWHYPAYAISEDGGWT